MEALGFKLNDLGQWVRTHEALPEVTQQLITTVPEGVTLESQVIIVASAVVVDEAFEQAVRQLLERLQLSPLELLLNLSSEIDNETFFMLPEKYWHLEEVLPVVTQLEAKGLVFDFSQAQSAADQNLMAIDCVDYIKFIPLDRFNQEKRARQLVEELSEQTSYPEVVGWLENVYYHHLLSAAFQSNEIHHILDWLNDPQTDRQITQKSLSYDRAVAKSEQWTEIENQKLGIATLKDVEGVDIAEVAAAGPYLMVHLLSQDAKKREAKKMHNCIGRHHLNSTSIYSIRRHGVRVASIDLREGQVMNECKGPWNKGVESAHWLGVRECLDKMQVNWVRSNDLTNIGLKLFRVRVPDKDLLILIDSTSPWYNQGPNNTLEVGRFLDGIKFDEKESAYHKILNLIPEVHKLEVRTMLANLDFNEYLVCPLTRRLVHKSSDYSRLITPMEKLVDNFPAPWVQELGQLVDEIWTKSTANYDRRAYLTASLTKILEGKQIREAQMSSSELIEYRRWLQEICKLSDGHSGRISGFKLAQHPAHYQSLFSQVKTPADLMDRLTDFNKPLNRLMEAEADLRKLVRLQPLDIDGDPQTKRVTEPDECEHCRNHEIYLAQLSIVEDLDIQLAEIKEAQHQFAENLKTVQAVAEELLTVISRWQQFILKGGFVDVVQGKVRRPGISDYRDYFAQLDELFADLNEVGEEGLTGTSVFQGLSEVAEQLRKIEEFDAQLSRAIKRHLQGMTGYRCAECRGESEIDGNANLYADYRCSIEWELSRANWDVIGEAVSYFHKIMSDPQEFKRELMSWVKDLSE